VETESSRDSSSELDSVSSSRLPIAIRRAPLLRLTCLSEAPPRSSAVWVWRSRRVFTPPRGVRIVGPRPGYGHCSSLRLGSAPEFDPSRRAPSCTLSEVSDPQALPSRRDPPLPAVCLSGSRCALTLTMRLGALLPRRPPWCTFNQARSRDHRPSELDLAASAALLSEPASPLAIGHAGPQSTLSRSPVLRASSKRASLQGLSRCRLGPRVGGFPLLAIPGSPGFRLPGALPFCAPTSRAYDAIRLTASARPHRSRSSTEALAKGRCLVSLSRTSGKAP